MRVAGLDFEIPDLAFNPFSAMPLEGSKSDLYVGRLDIRKRLAQHIKFRSTRRILMVGDLGSGRTSLLRCSALKAPVSVHIDHISASNPHDSLLQRMYSELVGYDFPTNTVQLVNKMVDYSQTFTESLPLIVIDTPNVDDSVLFVALRDVLPALERLQAVIVVVVESKQRMNIQDSVLHSFDNVETLSQLSIDEVQALVEKRISSVSNEDFKLDFTHAKAIHDKTGGLPLEVVKLMRDAIDNYRLTDSGVIQQVSPLNQQRHLEEVHSEPFSQYVEEDAVESNDSEIIDASLPWNERDKEENSDNLVTNLNPFGFELDLDGLSESQELDRPVEDLAYSANPDTEELIIAESKPKVDAGAFGGLLDRTREFDDMDEQEPEEMVNQHSQHGSELWISKEMIEVEEKVEFEEHNSAELIYDEIGIEMDNNENILADQDAFESLEYQEPNNDTQTMQQLISILSRLVYRTNSKVELGNDDFLAKMMNLSSNDVGQKVDYPLNPTALSSLNSTESYVLSIARVRNYSPSDKEILEHLGVKRPRLSQISNKLLKSGILEARMKGRSRYYNITQSAKAQLIAWGIIGGDE